MAPGNKLRAQTPVTVLPLQWKRSTVLERKRILLADDHPGFLEEVRSLLDAHHEIAGAVADGTALAESALALDPDLIICDISMPGMTGFEAATKVRALGLKSKLIFLTVHSSPAYLKKARSLGVEGYVLKLRAFDQLLSAISRVLDGDTFVSPELEVSHRS
jgi:DNA-binding NarL/FixJ family response regulator